MNSTFKITVDLDSAKAEEKIDAIEKRAGGLIEKLKEPVEMNIEESSAVDNRTGRKASLLLDEMTSPGMIEKNEYEKNQSDITSLERKYSAERERIDRDEYRSRKENLDAALISTQLFLGKKAALYKVMSIAEATISAFNAANAALLPPPVGAGPILGEIQAAIVLMNGMKRVEKISATQIPGYANGGIVVGERGPEVIENMQDYAAGREELIRRTIAAVEEGYSRHPALQYDAVREIKNLREDLNKLFERPAVAYLNDSEAKKVYNRGSWIARKGR